MKMKGIILSSLFILGFMAITFAHDKGEKEKSKRKYDPNTVETLSGEVIKIHRVKNKKGQHIHILLKTENESIKVRLGPSWYLEEKSFTLEKGDQLNIIGSRVTFKDKTAIIAKEVKKGNETLILRDENGKKLWHKKEKKIETNFRFEP